MNHFMKLWLSKLALCYDMEIKKRIQKHESQLP